MNSKKMSGNRARNVEVEGQWVYVQNKDIALWAGYRCRNVQDKDVGCGGKEWASYRCIDKVDRIKMFG